MPPVDKQWIQSFEFRTQGCKIMSHSGPWGIGRPSQDRFNFLLSVRVSESLTHCPCLTFNKGAFKFWEFFPNSGAPHKTVSTNIPQENLHKMIDLPWLIYCKQPTTIVSQNSQGPGVDMCRINFPMFICLFYHPWVQPEIMNFKFLYKYLTLCQLFVRFLYFNRAEEAVSGIAGQQAGCRFFVEA